MNEKTYRPDGGRHHVVIIGSGFGGMFAAQDLRNADVDITLIDRGNHHLFAPLLYQVATGILAAGEIAPSIRQVLTNQENVSVIKGEVTDINLDRRAVTTRLGDYERTYEYDSLIVAAGAGQSYFGKDEFAEFAPGMKSLDDALEIRGRLISAFERAELTDDPAERERLLTFVIIGAGPTGVELAGQLAEMANRTLRGEYRQFEPSSAKIILLDGASQVLPPFGKRLGRKAQRHLEKLGITVKLNAMVTNVDQKSVTYKDTQTGVEETIATHTKIWSAGVQASPLGALIGEQSGAEVERNGKIRVNPDLTVGDYRNVFVIGDMMSLDRLPGVAQVAMQSGQYAAEQIIKQVEDDQPIEDREPFDYFDKGSMAILSRFYAVVKLNNVEVTGFFGWILWLVIHVMYLVGFRNRLVTAINWGLNSLSRKRWNLVCTRQQLHARTGLNKLSRLVAETGVEEPIEVRDTARYGEVRFPTEK